MIRLNKLGVTVKENFIPFIIFFSLILSGLHLRAGNYFSGSHKLESSVKVCGRSRSDKFHLFSGFIRLIQPRLPLKYRDTLILSGTGIGLGKVSTAAPGCGFSPFQIAYGGPGTDELFDIIQNPDGTFLASGMTNSFSSGGDFDGWLLKTDAQGNVLWSKTYGGSGNDLFKKVIATSDGGYLISGVTGSSGIANGDGWVVKVDAFGNVQWQYSLGDPDSDLQTAIQSRDGGFTLIFFTNIPGNSAVFHIARLNSAGGLIWAKGYEGISSGFGNNIIEAPDGNFLVCGFSFSFGAGSSDIFLMKVDSLDGNIQWVKSYGSPGDDVAQSLILDTSGNIFMGGKFDNFYSFLFKLDGNGNLIFARGYADPGYTLRTVCLGFASQGELTLGIRDETPSIDRIIRVDDSGNLLWSRKYGNTVNGFQGEMDFASSMNNQLAVATFADHSPDGIDGVILKTDSLGHTNGCLESSTALIQSNLVPVLGTGSFTVLPWLTLLTPVCQVSSQFLQAMPVCPNLCCWDTTQVDTAICQGNRYTLPGGDSVDTAGLFQDSVFQMAGCDSLYITRLTLSPVPRVSLGADTTLCQGSFLFLNASNQGSHYLWQDGSLDSVYQVSSAGIYKVVVTNSDQCSNSDSIQVAFKPAPRVFWGNDTLICSGDSLLLDAGNPGDSYTWQDLSTGQTYLVTRGGPYSVQVLGPDGCEAADTINIGETYVPGLSILPASPMLCPGRILRLTAIGTNADNYLWNDGTTTADLDISQASRYYWVTISNLCGTTSDTVYVTQGLCNVYVPNAFTPNGDGRNDLFQPLLGDPVTNYRFDIFDRWGRRVFHTGNPAIGWDGNLNGIPCPDGGYVYIISFLDSRTGKPRELKGDLTLIR